MSAPDNVLVQVNLKDTNGALYNVYGHDEDSFRDGLNILKAYVAEIAEVQSHLLGAATVTAAMPVTAGPPAAVASPPAQPPQVAPSWGQPPAPAAPVEPAAYQQPQAPAAFQQAATPSCQHGPRTARGGNGAKGPWRAWMCPTPKGTPGQCEPLWVRKGTPEWDTFPA